MKVSKLAKEIGMDYYRVWRWAYWGNLKTRKRGREYEIPDDEVDFVRRVVRRRGVYTIRELAEKWGVHETTVLRRLKRHRVRMRRLMGRIWVLEEDLAYKNILRLRDGRE